MRDLTRRNLFISAVLVLAALSLPAFFAGCGGGGSDDDDGAPADDSDADDDSGGTDDDDDTSADDADDDADDTGDDTADDDAGDDTGDDTSDDTSDDDTVIMDFPGTVVDPFTDDPIPFADVEILDNETGQSFNPPVSSVANASGEVTVTYIGPPIDLAAFKTSADGRKDTYEFDRTAGGFEYRFLSVGETDFTAFHDALPVTPDPSKALLVGAFFYLPTAGGVEPVGCAEMTLAPDAGDLYYGVNGGSGPEPSSSRDVTTPGDPHDGEGIDPAVGIYFVFFLPDDSYTVTGTVGGQPYERHIGAAPADAVVVSSIELKEEDVPANPTPVWCTN